MFSLLIEGSCGPHRARSSSLRSQFFRSPIPFHNGSSDSAPRLPPEQVPMNVTAGDLSFSLDDVGQGHPLLLVHGFPLNRGMWRHQVEAFAATHRVIAPDLRGFGGSSPP